MPAAYSPGNRTPPAVQRPAVRFTALFRSSLRPYEEALVQRIREDSEAGRLRPGLDADGVASLMVGAFLGELVRHGTVADDWLDRCLEILWLVLDGTPS